MPTTSPAPAPTASPAPAPRVTAMELAAPIVAGRAALLRAQVSGEAQRLEWDFNGDGRPEVSCDGDQPTLRFRASAVPDTDGARTVSVRAVGAAGAGPTLAQSFPVAAATTSGSARLDRSISALVGQHPPVYACGRAEDLDAATGELTTEAKARMCLPRRVTAGVLTVEGCLQPVKRVDDIPPAERGILLALARALRVPVPKNGAMIGLGSALALTDLFLGKGRSRSTASSSHRTAMRVSWSPASSTRSSAPTPP